MIGRALVVPGADGRNWSRRRSGGARYWTPWSRYDGNGSLSCRPASGIRQTLEGWPANVALRARAAGLVQDDATEGVLAASLAQRARILTLAIDASLIHGAVVVNGTGAI